MSYHIHKDEIQLQWLDNRDTVKRELANLTRRVENEVMRVLDDAYTEGIEKGEILKVRPGDSEMVQLYADSMLKALGLDQKVLETANV